VSESDYPEDERKARERETHELGIAPVCTCKLEGVPHPASGGSHLTALPDLATSP